MVVGGPLLRERDEPLDRYRPAFRPSAQTAEPWVAVSLDVLVADSDDRAQELLLPEAWAVARARTTGVFPALEPVADIGPMTPTQRRYVDLGVGRSPGSTAAELVSAAASPVRG